MKRRNIVDAIRDRPIPVQPCPYCGDKIVVYKWPDDWVARCAKCEKLLPLVAREVVSP